jgi:hypothetical protein
VTDPGPPRPRAAPVAYGSRLPSQAGAPRKRVILAGPPPLSTTATRACAAGLLVAVGLGVSGLFPVSTVGAPAESQSLAEILLHVMGPGAWFVGAVLMLAGTAGTIRVGNALAAGATVVTTGITVVSSSELIGSKVSLGAGFYLGVASDLVAVVAAVVGFIVLRRSTAAGGLDRVHLWRLVPAVIAGVAIVAGYIPAWQRVHLASGTGKSRQTFTPPALGQFDARWEVIAGHVIILVGLVAAPIAASQWRRARAGGALIVGAVVGFAALVLTTVAAARRPFAQFNKVQLAEIKKARLTESVHFLGWFYVLLAGVVLLAAVGVVALLARRSDPELDVASRRS